MADDLAALAAELDLLRRRVDELERRLAAAKSVVVSNRMDGRLEVRGTDPDVLELAEEVNAGNVKWR